MDTGLRAFREFLGGDESRLDLGHGALLVAQVEHPGIVVSRELGRLDDLAQRSGAGVVGDPVKALHRLREFLFEEEGFHGNAEKYYDPCNSCLNDVLTRRTGIPISLSVVTMEVGRRVGLTIDGIGLPAHFVVAARMGRERVLLDPFDGGSVLTHAGAEALVARALGRRVRLRDDHFRPLSTRQILARMLGNLKGIYARAEAWDKALAVVERLLAVDDECAAYVRDRGAVRARLGRLGPAASDFEAYLTLAPAAQDADGVRKQLRRVRERLAALN
ncbi:MAG: tetratricopeptide repeat protein [Candidatus Rokubacteria bacterium]|nr:tetratricopeptide repeat protein [Candidatus Rokubacteria bacterium]